jgi:hypothetical protein
MGREWGDWPSTNKLWRAAVDPQSRQLGACLTEKRGNRSGDQASKISAPALNRGGSAGRRGLIAELLATAGVLTVHYLSMVAGAW